jgi:hypothetical protein
MGLQFNVAILLGAGMLATSIGDAIAQSLPPKVLTYPYPAAGVRIGQGWDGFNLQGTAGSCVNVSEAVLEQSAFDTSMEQLQSTYSLVTKTTTSVSAAYRGFGASASGSMNTSSSFRLRSDDQNVMFSFKSSHGSTFAVPPHHSSDKRLEMSEHAVKALAALKSESTQQAYLARILQQPGSFPTGVIELTEEAKKLRNDDSGEFKKKCGDGFISAIHRGARIDLVLTQKLASREEANSLAAALSASGFGGSLNASYSASTQKLSSTDKLSYRIFQQGGIPLKPEALKPLAPSTFFDVNALLPPPDQLMASPTAFTVSVTSYDALPGVEANPEVFPSTGNMLTIADYYLALRDIYYLAENALDEIRSKKDGATFDPKLVAVFRGEAHLESVFDAIRADLAFLESVISQCYSKKQICTVDGAIKQTMQDYDVMFEPYIKAAQTSSANATDAAKTQPQSTPTTMPAYTRDAKAEAAGKRFLDLARMTKDGVLHQDFFLRFYQYLTLIPLPKVAYSSGDFAALVSLSYQTAVANDQAVQLAAANDAMRRAVLTFRLTPWKRFFCEKMMGSPLCVPDSVLRVIIEDTQPKVAAETLRAIEPEVIPPRTRERYRPDLGFCPGPHKSICI